MSQSVLSKVKVRESHDRSGADLSLVRPFVQNAGELHMVFCKPVIAGTSGVLNRAVIARSSQVLKPAFQNVTEHFDFWLVPMHHLLSQWEDFKLNINDLHSSMLLQQAEDSNFTPTLSMPNVVPWADFGNDFINRSGWNVLSYAADGADSIDVVTRSVMNGRLNVLENADIPLKALTLPNGTAFACNLFRLAAYQACYYAGYRNQSYESNDPYAYNLDWLYASERDNMVKACLTPGQSTKDNYVLNALTRMRYANYRNDYVHNIYPNLNYVSSSPTGGDWSLPDNVVYQVSVGGNSSQITQRGANGGQTTLISPLNISSNQSLTSVQQIRAAFALDKLMRASAYTPKTVKAQMEARYGVRFGDDPYKVHRIGSFVNDFNFQEVTQVVDTLPSDSVASNLGDVGGKGFSMSDPRDEDLHFTAPKDSLVVCIHYFLPRARYDANGADYWNLKLQREQFFIEEFQNLGLRPIYSDILDATTNTILGYTVPNSEYKISMDKNYSLFKLQDYQFIRSNGSNSLSAMPQNYLTTFVSHNLSVNVASHFQRASYFKVKPSDLDPIFAEQFTGEKDRFQFFGDIRIKCAIVHNMDVHGQPSI